MTRIPLGFVVGGGWSVTTVELPTTVSSSSVALVTFGNTIVEQPERHARFDLGKLMFVDATPVAVPAGTSEAIASVARLESEEERGKEWVGERARQIADSLGLAVERKWGRSDTDFDCDRWSLALHVRGVRQVAKFSAEDLEDCGAGDEVKRAGVEVALRSAINELMLRVATTD